MNKSQSSHPPLPPGSLLTQPPLHLPFYQLLVIIKSVVMCIASSIVVLCHGLWRAEVYSRAAISSTLLMAGARRQD
ncbi:hypothetical protein AUEXF2481DRAFT_37176 [Aureobasidium subglaciale EXF-2481]|uniref:Uncharacterized protein n=1 Tax=Aureobasidium subglaciale (strain EXF-2481) TaxID=1043005 RepID=A0A074YIP4_AURSE|nr:uncharacterized protein AUEXF2481DRAFT_37176 [Aureobasidium subglaciale EXF-2481]KEQ97638.1 hypothetical protein AUEXF2481DRAFT_37176 [Aureobasidium subglaciale EXF-2481]